MIMKVNSHFHGVWFALYSLVPSGGHHRMSVQSRWEEKLEKKRLIHSCILFSLYKLHQSVMLYPDERVETQDWTLLIPLLFLHRTTLYTTLNGADRKSVV